MLNCVSENHHHAWVMGAITVLVLILGAHTGRGGVCWGRQCCFCHHFHQKGLIQQFNHSCLFWKLLSFVSSNMSWAVTQLLNFHFSFCRLHCYASFLCGCVCLQDDSSEVAALSLWTCTCGRGNATLLVFDSWALSSTLSSVNWRLTVALTHRAAWRRSVTSQCHASATLSQPWHQQSVMLLWRDIWALFED